MKTRSDEEIFAVTEEKITDPDKYSGEEFHKWYMYHSTNKRSPELGDAPQEQPREETQPYEAMLNQQLKTQERRWKPHERALNNEILRRLRRC